MKNAILICCTILFACSCQKETMPKLELVDVTARVEVVNPPDCNGSDITIILEVNREGVMIETIQNQYVNNLGNGGLLNTDISEWTEDASGNLRNSWCYTFDVADSFEEKYKLIGMTEMGQPIESKEVSVRIERPAGSGHSPE